MKLLLKFGAPVILTCNMSPTLVNGSLGPVVSVADDTVMVNFLDTNETHPIPGNYFQFVNGQLVPACRYFWMWHFPRLPTNVRA